MKKYSIILALSMLIFSCEKEIDLDIPDNGTNIVVNGMLTPDSTLQVHVSGSLHILDNGTPPSLDAATVTITNNTSGATETLTGSGDGWYESTTLPQVGQSYKIDVSRVGYTSVSGSTNIPPFVNITSWDTVRKVSFGDIESTELSMRFTDPNGENNYYYVYAKVVNDDGFGNVYSYLQGFYSRDAVIDQSTPENYHYQGFTFSDDLIEGSTHELKLYFDDYLFEAPSGTIDLDIFLVSASKDYYEYIRTYAAYLESNGDPFSQPVIIYSNINEGHGVFAGYNVDVISISL